LKVLVDSSVWIPFLRGRAELAAEVTVAMSEGRSHLCPVIWVEIFRGVRGKREERLVAELAALCPSLPMDGESWDEAARLGRAASQAGLNCPLADVLIAACARRHKAKLIHDDKHLKALLEL
jgi:predicted nucleic acid-binding protein